MAVISIGDADYHECDNRRGQRDGRDYYGSVYAAVYRNRSVDLHLQKETTAKRPGGIFCGIFLDAETAAYRPGASVRNCG